MESPDDLGADRKLSALLKEWQIEGASPSLDARVLGEPMGWWRFLLKGSIRVPAPVAIAVCAMLLVAAAVLIYRGMPAPAAPTSLNLADFRPVKDFNVRVIRAHREATNDAR